ncbi:N-acetyl-gamma-glutamyl-phosphate reductase [Thermosulfuriphilus sp.]
MSEKKIAVAVIGATGYTGAELLRLLASHPQVELTCVTSRQEAGKALGEVFPSLGPFYPDLFFIEPDLEQVASQAEVAFCCVPHKAAMAMVPDLLAAGLRVIDLSADFRLKDARVYEDWYETPHTAQDLLPEAVYGLPELWRTAIRKAKLVANPGCYPTSVILALYPLLAKGLIKASGIIVDSKSGVSGAGRSAKLPLIFSEVNEAFRAYGLPRHRHIPEMEQELSKAAGRALTISFTPHLLPVNRGILSTIYVIPNEGATDEDLRQVLMEYYADEPFVLVLPRGVLPDVSHVRGTNQCRLAVVFDVRARQMVIISVIDNLVKGASGQALQNMNLMFGLKETLGLELPALYP